MLCCQKRHGGIDKGWAEVKKSVLESAQEHLKVRHSTEAKKVDDRSHH